MTTVNLPFGESLHVVFSTDNEDWRDNVLRGSIDRRSSAAVEASLDQWKRAVLTLKGHDGSLSTAIPFSCGYFFMWRAGRD